MAAKPAENGVPVAVTPPRYSRPGDKPASWTIEQVVAIAPTPARFAAAEGLAVPARWVSLGADERVAPGAAAGAPGASRTTPWSTTPTSPGGARARAGRTRASTPWPCWSCGCAARSPRPPRRPAVGSWVDGHRRRDAAARRTSRAGARRRCRRRRRDRGRTTPRRRRRRPRAGARRAGRAVAGAGSSSSTAGSTTACAPGSPTRRSPATPRGTTSRPGSSTPGPGRSPTGSAAWPAWSAPGPTGTRSCSPSSASCTCSPRPASGSPSCPGALADAVATACGWQVRQADVLAGVPETDTWVVAGRSDTPRGPHRGPPDVAARPVGGSLGDGPVVRRLPPVARRLAAPSARPSPPTSTATPGRRRGRSSARSTTTAPRPAPRPAGRHRRRGLRGRSARARRRAVARPGAGTVRRRARRRPTGAGCSPTHTGSLPLVPDAPGLADAARRVGGPAGRRHRGVDRRRRRPAHRAPRRPGARHRPARRPLVRERGMTTVDRRPLARAGHRRAARHRPARPARAAARSAGRRRRRRPAPPRRPSGCSPPSAPASPPGGPALLPLPPAPLARPAGADDRADVPVAAARRWRRIVAEWPVLEDEWLQEVERRGWRLAPDVLVGLLRRHRTRRRPAGPRRARSAARSPPGCVEHQPDLRPPPGRGRAAGRHGGCPASPCRRRCSPLLDGAAGPVVAAVARRARRRHVRAHPPGRARQLRRPRPARRARRHSPRRSPASTLAGRRRRRWPARWPTSPPTRHERDAAEELRTRPDRAAGEPRAPPSCGPHAEDAVRRRARRAGRRRRPAATAELAAVAVGRRHVPARRACSPDGTAIAPEVRRPAAAGRDRRGHAGHRPGAAAARRARHGQDVGQRAPRRGDQRRLDAARPGHRRHHRGVAALRLELRPAARRGPERGRARAEPGLPGDAHRAGWCASRS